MAAVPKINIISAPSKLSSNNVNLDHGSLTIFLKEKDIAMSSIELLENFCQFDSMHPECFGLPSCQQYNSNVYYFASPYETEYRLTELANELKDNISPTIIED